MTAREPVQNHHAITDVPGVRVGHYTDRANATGCTVVICEDGAVGGVDVRGSAPGTRETDLLDPTATVEEVHAVLLSGGSAFGLAAAAGVVQYLEENDIGLKRLSDSVIPIVPAAILFDLGVITDKVRPGPDEGRAACEAATSGPVAEGSVGAGTGATVAKLLGRERGLKGGVGTYALDLGGGLIVGAIVAVNAVGGVFDPDTGRIVAGPIAEDGATMLDSMKLITDPDFPQIRARAGQNTTIGVVATNARLNKPQASKLASVAHDGLALSVRPAHLMSDGDTMFALATGSHDAETDLNRLCAASALCVSRAILRAVQNATGLGGIRAASELP